MKLLSIAVVLLGSSAFGNTPGQVSVALTWSEITPGVTFNLYRGSATGVCSGTPTPFATGITNQAFTDTTATAGQTYFYAVSAVKGVESTCSSEVQIAVPSPPAPPTNLQGH